MFDFLKSDSSEEEEELERVIVTSRDPNVVPTNGSALIKNPEQEELAQEPEVRETGEGTVIELGKFEGDRKVAESDSQPETLEIDADVARRNSAWFTEEELAEIEKESAKEQFSEEELESHRKVEEALNDPDIPASDIDELWRHVCRKHGVFGMSEEEEYSSKEEAIRENLGDRDWVDSGDKPISEMTGSEFAEIIQQAQNPDTGEEELEQSPVEFEELSETEENTVQGVSEELASEASEAFENRAKDPSGSDYWSDIAEEIEMEAKAPEGTEVMSVNEGVVFRTENQQMREELQYEATTGDNVEILSDAQGVLEAHVKDPSKFE